MPCVWLPNGVRLNVREEAFKNKSFMKFLDRVRKKAQKGSGSTWPEMARILESCSESPDAKIELIEDKGFLSDNNTVEKNPPRNKTESADKKYPPKEKPKKPKPHLKVVK
ncbi:MAG: hypothetical protein AB1427_08975 [Thermodesulfobacteriota bacterium]